MNGAITFVVTANVCNRHISCPGIVLQYYVMYCIPHVIIRENYFYHTECDDLPKGIQALPKLHLVLLK